MLYIVVLVVLFLLFYVYRSKSNAYFKKRGVPTASNSHWFFGHFKQIVFTEKHVGTVMNDIYYEFPDAPAVGYFKMNKPELLVRDPELVKAILVTDFNSFAKNVMKVDKKIDFLFGNNPFVLHGEEWKIARSHGTPNVTFAKLKNYQPILLNVGDEMVKYIRRKCNENDMGFLEQEAKSLAGMFTTDTVSNAICGIVNNTFEDSNSVFATITREIFSGDFLDYFKNIVTFIFPDLRNILRLRFSTKRAEDILLALTRKMMKERVESGEVRHDFFHQMVSNRQNGKADVFTDEYIASQLYGFLLDGYETSSVLISFAMFELAWHSDVQEKLRNEVLDMIKRTEGSYSVEDVESLHYLDMVVSETLRLHVPLLVITKECTMDYAVSGLKGLAQPFTIESGTTISIPVYSFHMDPKYFPSPEKFDPERFTEEEVAKRNKYVYLPFGEGPRKCFGSRFGVLQSKVAIIKLLENVIMTPSDKSSYPLQIDPQVFLLKRSLNGAWVKIKPRSG